LQRKKKKLKNTFWKEMSKENPNPVVHKVNNVTRNDELDDDERDPIDELEIFGFLFPFETTFFLIYFSNILFNP